MLPLDILSSHWRLLAFGWLMSFSSGFGQTYFIAIFGGLIRSEFGLSHAVYGTCYSAGTLASAGVLLWAGRLIDTRSLASFSAGAVVGLAIATVLMASAAGVLTLGIAIFASRFFGQGLMTHAAMTAMGRYFAAERGRAVSIAALGHVMAQAVLPIAAVGLMAFAPWRVIWLMGGAALIAATLPAILFLLRGAQLRQAKSRATEPPPTSLESAKRDATLREALREIRLYAMLPALLAPAFIATGLIFHQVHIGAQKGWSLGLMASSLSVYAACSLVMMLAAGWLVDRCSAKRLLPFSVAPLAASCAVLAYATSAPGALTFFGLMGLGSGFTAVLFASIWPELYGVAHLGAIRAFGASAMVFASGLAPAALGALFDLQWTVSAIALLCAVYCLAASMLALLATRRP